MKCKICNKEIKFKGFATHITIKHQMTSKEYYDTYMKKPNDDICKTCGKPTKFKSIKFGYVAHCSNSCAQLDPKVIAQKAQTCINKYGVDNAYKSNEIKNKIKNTCVKRYGVDSVLKLNAVREKTYNSIASDQVKNKILSTKQDRIKKFEIENDCTLKQTLRHMYGQGWLKLDLEELVLNDHAHFIKNSDIPKIIDCVESNGSSFEYKVKNYIKSIYGGKIIYNTRSIIKPLELDIYIPDKNIAIECNGLFWHSSLNDTNKNYHYNKSLKCQEKGIRLIHIYEPEWYNQEIQIKKLLYTALCLDTNIYENKYDIKLITNKEAKLFNENNHLDGHKNADITYGLFYENKLIQIMSFSKLFDNNWEIIRNNSDSNNIIINRAKKLFRKFITDYNPAKIYGYCDFNKFDGKLYSSLGMTFIDYTGPNSWSIINNDIISKDSKKYNNANANIRGVLYGSGSKKYEIII